MCGVSVFLVILNYTQVYFLGEKGITGSRVQTHTEKVGNNLQSTSASFGNNMAPFTLQKEMPH